MLGPVTTPLVGYQIPCPSSRLILWSATPSLTHGPVCVVGAPTPVDFVLILCLTDLSPTLVAHFPQLFILLQYRLHVVLHFCLGPFQHLDPTVHQRMKSDAVYKLQYLQMLNLNRRHQALSMMVAWVYNDNTVAKYLTTTFENSNATISLYISRNICCLTLDKWRSSWQLQNQAYRLPRWGCHTCTWAPETYRNKVWQYDLGWMLSRMLKYWLVHLMQFLTPCL